MKLISEIKGEEMALWLSEWAVNLNISDRNFDIWDKDACLENDPRVVTILAISAIIESECIDSQRLD